MAGGTTRVMYLELKSGYSDDGPAWIGRVSFSQTGRTLYYKDLAFQSCGGSGIRGNYFEINSGDEYWISGPKRNGQDRHSCGTGAVRVDADVVDEYWQDIRRQEPPKNPLVV